MHPADQIDVSRLKQQAEQISNKGNLAEALQILDEAAQQAADLADPLAMALVWRGRANVYQRHYRSEESLAAASQAAKLYQEYGTPFEVALAQTISVYSLGVLERFDEAVALANQIRPHFAEFPLGLTKLAEMLGQIYSWQGHYEKAMSLYMEVKAFYTRSGDQKKLAGILHSIGVTAQRMDNFSLARDCFAQAYPLYVQTENIVGIIKVKSNLAKLCIRQNQLQEALHYLAEARQVITRLPASPDVGRLDLFEARVRRLLNQPQRAAALLQSAHARFEAAGWGIEAAEVLIELAHILALDATPDHLQQSLTYLQQAEAHVQMLQVPFLVAFVRLEQAELLLRLGRVGEAVEKVQVAHQVFAEAGLVLRQAQAAVIWGDCTWRTDGRLARSHYLSALEVTAQTVPLLAARCWQGLGRLALASEDIEKAEAAFSQSWQQVDWMRYTLSQHYYQATFLADKQTMAEDMLRGLHRQPDRYVERIFKWVEQIKGRALADLLQGQPPVSPGETPDKGVDVKTQSLLAAREVVAQELDQCWQTFTGPGSADLGAAGGHRSLAVSQEQKEQSRLNELVYQLQTIDEQLSCQQHPPHLWRQGQAITLEVAQTYLDEQTLMVSYYSVGQELYALTAAAETAAVQVTPLEVSIPDIEKAWRQSRRAILRPSASLGQVQKRLGQFWHWLLGPISHQIGDKRRLLIIPHKGLFHIPFACLYDDLTEAYLVERMAVQVAPSVTIWHHCQQQTPSAGSPLLVGYPGQVGEAAYLAAVQPEIEALRQQLPQAVVLFGEQATRSAVLVAAQSCSWLHLAGHIFYDGQEPLASGMPLANGRWLRASDLYVRYGQLKGAMVVLSGCESGRIQPQGGEVLGLTSAFLYAGARCLVASLWPVSDTATAVLMQHFYQQLQAGLAVDEALRAAQVVLRQQAALAHPYYWAAFSLIGAGTQVHQENGVDGG